MSTQTINPDTPLISQARLEGTSLRCELSGSLTIVNAPELRPAFERLLNEHRPQTLAIHLADVRYIDSGALGVLIETRKQATKLNCKVVLHAVPKDILALLKIMKLDAVFTIADE
jgi:anti-anti-sigma factor